MNSDNRSVWITVMFSFFFQMEVTFNFLEIRAMNTYPEHQVMRLCLFIYFLSCC